MYLERLTIHEIVSENRCFISKKGVKLDSKAASTACFGKSSAKNTLTEFEYHLSLLDGPFKN